MAHEITLQIHPPARDPGEARIFGTWQLPLQVNFGAISASLPNARLRYERRRRLPSFCRARPRTCVTSVMRSSAATAKKATPAHEIVAKRLNAFAAVACTGQS